ncbi:MAG TPA: hypothetical protein VEC19_02825 [Usitatibacter sp.]|nr:hypothetical protein [Usitatibacter sp.]
MKFQDRPTFGCKIWANAAIVGVTLALASCGEIPQDGPKPFAGEDEIRSYAGSTFKGDQALYEKTLAERARTQDEYLITGDAKK